MMTDYKRLTRKSWHDTKFAQLNPREVLYRLWQLENQIENGTLIELPCKVGDTVYRVLHSPDFVYGWELDTFIIQSDGIIAFDKSNTIIKPSDWGETVFLTRAEAEARLEQLKRSNQ